MRIAAFLIILLGALPLRAQKTADTDGKKLIDYKDHYTMAFKFFTTGQYSKSIEQYNKVLEIDEDQKTAKKMIRTAREKIDERDKKEQAKMFGYARQGIYQSAYLELQPLLERDPTHPLYGKLQDRLELLIEIVRRAPKTKAWTSVVRGLAGYITRQDDMRLAYNGLRNAIDIEPRDIRFRKILKLIIKENPRLTEERITPGMKLLAYKRFVALNNIYDGKYHLAVDNLNQVLALEPRDLVSLKRLGSAYYSLKRYKRAEAIWSQALKLTPKDRQLHKFVARAKRARPARKRKSR